MAEGVLGRIAAAKREELASRFDGVSLDALRARAVPTRRRLAAALAQDGARFILEIKKASPSGGAIRPDADPTELARGYAGVADALSVLSDGPHFGGSLGDLAAARRAFDGPILAKDFFIDPRQVAEARIAGADAVLVMLSLLDDAAARAMIEEARRFVAEHRKHDQHRVGAGEPRLDHLARIDHEILRKDGPGERGADRAQIVERAAEIGRVGEHADRVGGAGISARLGGGIGRGQGPGRGRSLLHLHDEARAAPGEGRAQAELGRRRLRAQIGEADSGEPGRHVRPLARDDLAEHVSHC